MAGLMLPNILICGSSGSGKSTHLRALVSRMADRARYTVVVNTSRELADLADHREFVDNAQAARSFRPADLAGYIRHYRRVHFEIAAADPRPLLNALGEACMSLGRYDAAGCEVLLVVDECQAFLSKRNITPGMIRVETEGRKYGVVPVKATQQLASSGVDTIDHVSIRQARQIFVFPLSEINERERIARTFPELPDSGGLLFPDPAHGFGPEYLAMDRPTGRGYRVTRRPDGTRYAAPVGAGLEQT